MKLIAYIHPTKTILKPTGKWQIIKYVPKYGKSYQYELLIQHKTRFTKKWISEYSINLEYPPIINSCYNKSR